MSCLSARFLSIFFHISSEIGSWCFSFYLSPFFLWSCAWRHTTNTRTRHDFPQAQYPPFFFSHTKSIGSLPSSLLRPLLITEVFVVVEFVVRLGLFWRCCVFFVLWRFYFFTIGSFLRLLFPPCVIFRHPRHPFAPARPHRRT